MDTTAPVPDFIEPIIGYRVWTVTGGAHRPLRLYSFCTEWEPYTHLVARHLTPVENMMAYAAEVCDACPCDLDADHGGFGFGCGIYAMTTLARAVARVVHEHAMGRIRAPLVVGTVALWGRVAFHQQGYRAQFAYPHSIIAGYQCDAVALAAEYGVPVHNQEGDIWRSGLSSINDLSSRYPPPFRFDQHRNRMYWTPPPSLPPSPSSPQNNPNPSRNLSVYSANWRRRHDDKYDPNDPYANIRERVRRALSATKIPGGS